MAPLERSNKKCEPRRSRSEPSRPRPDPKGFLRSSSRPRAGEVTGRRRWERARGTRALGVGWSRKDRATWRCVCGVMALLISGGRVGLWSEDGAVQATDSARRSILVRSLLLLSRSVEFTFATSTVELSGAAGDFPETCNGSEDPDGMLRCFLRGLFCILEWRTT